MPLDINNSREKIEVSSIPKLILKKVEDTTITDVQEKSNPEIKKDSVSISKVYVAKDDAIPASDGSLISAETLDFGNDLINALPKKLAPVQIVSSVLLSTKRKDELGESFKKESKVDVLNDSFYLSNSAWIAVCGAANTAQLVATKTHVIAVGAKTMHVINGTSSTLNKWAGKVALPLTATDLALSVYGLKKDLNTIDQKEKELDELKKSINSDSNVNKEESLQQKKLEKELKLLKTDQVYKDISLGFLAASTIGLAVALVKPAIAETTLKIVLGTSICDSFTTLISDNKTRTFIKQTASAII